MPMTNQEYAERVAKEMGWVNQPITGDDPRGTMESMKRGAVLSNSE